MKYTYRKITPSDIWFSYRPKELSESQISSGLRLNEFGNIPSPNDFIDLFAGLIKRLRYVPLSVYATRMGISEAYLSPAIVAVTGLSPKAWIAEFTGRAACELLSETQMPINKISKQLGFLNVETFSHFFSRKYKIAPSTWRLRHK